MTLAQDQSSHVMWELLLVGLEIRGGSRKAGQEITGQGKVRNIHKPEVFPPEMSQERLWCPGGCGECQELRARRMRCIKHK